MAAIYFSQTKKAGTITWDPVNGHFKGDFFRIVELVDIAAATALGREPMTNIALGKLIQNVRQ